MLEASIIFGAIAGGIAGLVSEDGKTFFAFMLALTLVYVAGFLAGYNVAEGHLL